MFGFGKSQIEKVLLNRAIESLRPFGLESEAENILDKAKSETLSLTSDLNSVTFGDSLIQSEDYVRTRESEGLSKEEIREYWNVGIFVRCLDSSIKEFFQFLVVNTANLEGKDPAKASREYHKEAPRYGNPKDYNKELPVYEGLSELDAPIPVELTDRIHKWEVSIDQATKEQLLNDYSSYSAMVRFLVSKGQL